MRWMVVYRNAADEVDMLWYEIYHIKDTKKSLPENNYDLFVNVQRDTGSDQFKNVAYCKLYDLYNIDSELFWAITRSENFTFNSHTKFFSLKS